MRGTPRCRRRIADEWILFWEGRSSIDYYATATGIDRDRCRFATMEYSINQEVLESDIVILA